MLLAYRFLVAAAGLAVAALLSRQPPWRIPRRSLLILLLMGVSGYSLQAFSFIYALRSLPASLVSLILYSYPALVAIGAWAFFGRRVTAVHIAGLVGSFAGVGLLVGGVHFVPGAGLFWAALAPIVYTAYILAGDRAMRDARPVAAALVVMASAALAFTVVAGLGGQLRPPPSPAAALLLAAIGLVPTLAAITLFLSALPRVGAGRAAVISTWEPVVTVGLAVALFGDRLSATQVLGAVLVLGAVVVLQLPAATPVPRPP